MSLVLQTKVKTVHRHFCPQSYLFCRERQLQDLVVQDKSKYAPHKFDLLLRRIPLLIYKLPATLSRHLG